MYSKNGYIRVLLADDKKFVRDNIRQLIEKEKDIKVVAEAKNGLEVVKLAKKLLPDIILMDVRMPEMNGKDFYRWLANGHYNLADRVIFTTGDVMDHEILDFISGTGRPFLPKPFTSDELTKVVKNNLRMNRKSRLVTKSNKGSFGSAE